MTAEIESRLRHLRGVAPPLLVASVEVGTGLVEGYAPYQSPLGEVVVTFNPRGVSSVDLALGDFEERFFGRRGKRLTRALPPAEWQRLIGKALEKGNPGDLPLDLGSLSGFRRQVLETAGTIPRGQVRPYSWLAAQMGRAGAARAVGSTMAHNPVPLIIPCHRVVRSDGRIGEYSLGGPENKWSLLRSEGADPEHLEELASRGVRYLASDSTRIFCLPTCRNARRITETHLVRFTTKESAASSGYHPCRICLP